MPTLPDFRRQSNHLATSRGAHRDSPWGFSHAYLTLDAAATGQGVAIASDVLAADAVRIRSLAIAPGTPVAGPYQYRLLTHRTAMARPQVGAFCDWLRVEAQMHSENGWRSPA